MNAFTFGIKSEDQVTLEILGDNLKKKQVQELLEKKGFQDFSKKESQMRNLCTYISNYISN